MAIRTLLPALVLTGLIAASSTHAQETEPAPRAGMAPSIVTVTAKRAHVVDRVLANGLISAVEEVFVQPQVEGLAVDALLADVGDRVEAGQVLARLSSDQLLLQKSQLKATRAKAEAGIAQLEAQLAEVQASAAEIEKAHKRAQELVRNGTYSKVQAEQAEAQAIGARAKVRSVEEAIKVAQADIAVVDAQMSDIDLRLSRTEVKAPVAGIVAARGAKTGAIASAAAGPMFTLIRDSALELRADVAESDVLKLKPGQTAMVSVPGSAAQIEGRIRLIEPTLSQATRLGSVRIELPSTEGLRAGLFAEARIVVSERDAVVVPVTSASISGAEASVLLVEDGIARQRSVKTGIRDGDRLEILEGVSDGDLIVAKAGAFVRDGDRVNPITDTHTGATAAVTE